MLDYKVLHFWLCVFSELNFIRSKMGVFYLIRQLRISSPEISSVNLLPFFYHTLNCTKSIKLPCPKHRIHPWEQERRWYSRKLDINKSQCKTTALATCGNHPRTSHTIRDDLKTKVPPQNVLCECISPNKNYHWMIYDDTLSQRNIMAMLLLISEGLQ